MTKPTGEAGSFNDRAAQFADEMHDDHFESPRGASRWLPGITLVYGNDGSFTGGKTDGRGAKQLELFRSHLATHGIMEVGFGVSRTDPEHPEEGGYSWAMLVMSGDVAGLNAAIWHAWLTSAEGDEAKALGDAVATRLAARN